MANLKPVIFIFPISPTLTKLKDELKNDPTLDINEVDDINEVVQLFQNVAPAMILTSDAKKGLKVLSIIEKHFKKTSSKMMLLTTTRLPMRAAAKAEKMGMTSIIEEPIATKTLIFKVNLLLRSLPTEKVDPNKGEMKVSKGVLAEKKEGSDKDLELQTLGDITKKSGLEEFDKNFKLTEVVTQQEKRRVYWKDVIEQEEQKLESRIGEQEA